MSRSSAFAHAVGSYAGIGFVQFEGEPRLHEIKLHSAITSTRYSSDDIAPLLTVIVEIVDVGNLVMRH